MRFAYNTNGTQNHRLKDAVALIADAGYDGVALTLDIHHLDPFAPGLPARAEALRSRLDALGLGSRDPALLHRVEVMMIERQRHAVIAGIRDDRDCIRQPVVRRAIRVVGKAEHHAAPRRC